MGFRFQKEGAMMKECFFCKGRTEEQLTKYIVDLGNCVLIVKNVPARVCQQCGEVTFSDDVVARLEGFVNTVRQSVMTEVAIFEYKGVA